MARSRVMPVELEQTLRRAAALESIAANSTQWRRAVHATSDLLLACREAGWRISEFAAPAELAPGTASKRIREAQRRRGDRPRGLTVPPPPARPPAAPSPLAVLELPLEQRDWLSLTEAHHYANVSVQAVQLWRRKGLLPRTRQVTRRFLYHRDDLDPVLAAPRYNNHGADHRAVLAVITAGADVRPRPTTPEPTSTVRLGGRAGRFLS